MESPDCNSVTKQEYKWLSAECSIIGILYLLLMIPIFHNVHWYCYKQQRYKVYLITVFYTMATLIVCFRSMMYFQYAAQNVKEQYFCFGNIASLIASFALFTLQNYQCVSQVDLVIRLDQTVKKVVCDLDPNEIKE